MITSLWQLFPLADDRAKITLSELARSIQTNSSVGNGKTSGGVRFVRDLWDQKGGEK